MPTHLRAHLTRRVITTISAGAFFSIATVHAGDCAPGSVFDDAALLFPDGFPVDPVVANLDADGPLDLVVGDGQGNVFVVLNDGTPTLDATYDVGGGRAGVAVGDVDGDSDIDIVATNDGGNTIEVLINDGTGVFAGGSESYSTGEGDPQSIALADIDGDTILDMIYCDANATRFAVRIGDGDGTFGAETRFSTTDGSGNGRYQFPILVDVVGDAELDIVFARNSGSSDEIHIWEGDGAGGFTLNQLVEVGDNPRRVASADLNDDGLNDLAVACANSNDVNVLMNMGEDVFDAPDSFATGDGCRGLAIGDVNEDGALDIVASNGNDETVTVLLSDGRGSFPGSATYTVGDGVASGSPLWSVVLTDLDGDFDLDVALAANDNFYTLDNYCDDAPAITKQPELTQLVQASTNVELCVEVSSADANLQYQWYKGDIGAGVVIPSGDLRFSGTESATLSFVRTDMSTTDRYYVEITDSAGRTAESDPALVAFKGCQIDLTNDLVLDLLDIDAFIIGFTGGAPCPSP